MSGIDNFWFLALCCAVVCFFAGDTSAAKISLPEKPHLYQLVQDRADLDNQFSGTWDGAIYSRYRSNDPQTRVTLKISGAVAQIWVGDNRPVDMTMDVKNGVGNSVTLKGSGVNASFYSTAKQSLQQDSLGRDVLSIIIYILPGGGPGQAYLTKRTSTNASPKEGEGFQKYCARTGQGWLYSRVDAERTGEFLKRDASNELSSYDAFHASLISILHPDTFRKFYNVNVEDISEEDFRNILISVRDCAITAPEPMLLFKYNVLADLFDQNAWSYEFNSRMQPWFWKPASRPAMTPLITQGQAREILVTNAKAEANITSAVAEATAAIDIAKMRSVIRTNGDRINSIRPEYLSKVVKPLIEKIARFKDDERQKILDERRKRAAKRMEGVSFPEDAIPERRKLMMHHIAAGDEVIFDVTDSTYLAGFVDFALEKCGKPEAFDARSKLASFVFNRALKFNIEPYTKNLQDGLNGLVSNNIAVLEGQNSAKKVGCSDKFIDVFLEDVIETLYGN